MADDQPVSTPLETKQPPTSPEWLTLIGIGQLPNEVDRALTVHDREAYEIVWPKELFERFMQLATYPGGVMDGQLDAVALTVREPGFPVQVEALGPALYRYYERRFPDHGVLCVTVKVINLEKKYGVIQAVVPILREGKIK